MLIANLILLLQKVGTLLGEVREELFGNFVTSTG